MRTWHGELAFVALALAVIVIARGAPLIEWVASLAVLSSFAHGQVADRLAEREGIRAALGDDKREDITHCWRWARRYYWAKEMLWAAFFWATGAWAALAGAVLFIAYPIWRRWWRRRSSPSVSREQEKDRG